MTDLKFKNLGDTKIKISSVGLGTGTGFKKKDKKRNQELVYTLQKSLDLGANFIDTAEVYFGGHAEELIGKAFKKNRKKVFIATKFSPEHCSYKDVIKAAEGSLKRLQTDYIDLYQIHWSNPLISINETLNALSELAKKGKIKYIGVCNFSLRQLRDIQNASKLPIVSLQTEYNLLDRSVENDLLEYCKKNKTTLIAYTPLNSGNILKKKKYLNMIATLSEKYNKTVSQIILNFLISHSPVIAIPSTTNILHLEENARSSDFSLEENDVQFIAKTFTTKIEYIDTKKIKAINTDDHNAYKTIDDALTNKLNFFPSPGILSEDILKGDFLKPVKVRKINSKDKVFEYELIGGRIRYWAWVIAYKGQKPIPAIIED